MKTHFPAVSLAQDSPNDLQGRWAFGLGYRDEWTRKWIYWSYGIRLLTEAACGWSDLGIGRVLHDLAFEISCVVWIYIIWIYFSKTEIKGFGSAFVWVFAELCSMFWFRPPWNSRCIVTLGARPTAAVSNSGDPFRSHAKVDRCDQELPTVIFTNHFTYPFRPQETKFEQLLIFTINCQESR